jgi:hypothetical protein
MSPTAGRWLVPASTALGILVLLFGMYAVVAGGSGAGVGPDHDRRGIDVPLPPLPTAQAQAVILGHGSAEITGYQASARRLTLTYTVQDRECTKLVIEPVVRESGKAVTIGLTRVPVPDMQLYACPTGPLTETADVVLSAALGNRVVRDAANLDAVVPVLDR